MYSLSREDLNEAVWEGVISASVAESLRVYMYQIAADRPVQEDGINEAAAEGRLREMVRREVVALSWRLLAIADDVKDTDRTGERERERERERVCSPCVDLHGYAFIDYLLGTLGPIPTLGWLSPCSHSFVNNRL